MKKTIFILTILFAATFAHAEAIKVILKDGQVIEGQLVKHTKSLLIMEPNTFVKYNKKLKPEKVESFEIENMGTFYSKDGMFVMDESTKKQEKPDLLKDSVPEVPKDFWQRVLSERPHKTYTLPADPNEVISRAFLTTGKVALGIGLPCLAAGVVTCTVGHVNVTLTNMKSKNACAEASYYLLGVGASLTIVSIPLIVHGNRIADMKFNYTWNGVGLALNF